LLWWLWLTGSQIENTLLVRPDVQNARKEQIPAIRMGKTLTPIFVITAVFGGLSIYLCPTASHRLYPCSLIPSSHHSESISIFTVVASGVTWTLLGTLGALKLHTSSNQIFLPK
jgi:membrane associated rhomboid family serine protease